MEIRERVEEITIPHYVEVERPAPSQPPLFANTSEEALLSYGVPAEWLDDVRRVTTEDSLLELADHLPKEAAEALLDLAVGVTPRIAQPVAAVTDPFDHPDAQRRFRVVKNVEELERALDVPVGEMDRLPPSGAARIGRAGLRRPGTGIRFGGHREDHRRPAPGRLPRPHASRLPACCSRPFLRRWRMRSGRS